MTYRITEAHDHTAAAKVCTRSPAPLRNGLTALLDQDDIVRPEFRNEAILAGRPRHPGHGRQGDARRQPESAGKSSSWI
ncbi:hypothetical protein [Halomonas ventosae]|uniref:Uncharacterized protein n=1 Tax=Halomonas ventosae TaxID=229007 RepID=A0A2T0VNX3_9GAMM|nr:hypothetical protein [Halomonas ventosae]PRY72052.1 hypothetical protein BCL64_105195 [Halomonas ventosae]